MTVGCTNVHHNAVDCAHSGLPFDEWCNVCIVDDMITPRYPMQYDVKDHNHERGDFYEYCDVCENMRFDVQVVHLGDSRPWTWDAICVCGGCRFTESRELAKQEAYMEQCAREEQEWLDNGGQELIDSEPYVPPEDRYVDAIHDSVEKYQ